MWSHWYIYVSMTPCAKVLFSLILLVHLKQEFILTLDLSQVDRWSDHTFWHPSLWSNIFILYWFLYTHKLCAKERSGCPIHCEPSGSNHNSCYLLFDLCCLRLWPMLFTFFACVFQPCLPLSALPSILVPPPISPKYTVPKDIPALKSHNSQWNYLIWLTTLLIGTKLTSSLLFFL